MKKLILLFFLFCISCSTLFAQSKIADKANKLYKEKRYAEAADLYVKALEEKPSLSVKTKLAFCYRIINKTTEAEKLYADITAQKKAKPKTYFYYGEMLMSNGKYSEAKEWFSKYEEKEPEDEEVKLLLAACDYAPTIQPFFEKIRIEEYQFNSEADDNTPVWWGDKLVFSSDRSSGGTKKSGFTGRRFINIFYSTKKDTSFSEPKVFSGKLSVSNKNTGNPSFTRDSTRIYFTRNGVELSKRSVYNLSLFTAESTGGVKWKNVEKIPFCSKEYNYMHPAISPDGKYLYYVSDKSRGEGGTDIWVSRLNDDGTWGRSQNLGYRINTVGNEGFPYIDKKGRLFFCSKGHPGFGGFDIFMSEKDENGEWQDPVNLGRPINSPRDDISVYVNDDGKSGMFTSNRSGGDDDIFFFDTKELVAPQEIIADSEDNLTVESIVEEVSVEENTPAIIAENPLSSENENTPVVTTDSTVTVDEVAERAVPVATDTLLAPIDTTALSDVIQEKQEVEEVEEISTSVEIIEKIEEDTLLSGDSLQLIVQDSLIQSQDTLSEEKTTTGSIENNLPEASEGQIFDLGNTVQKVEEIDLIPEQIFRLNGLKYGFEEYTVTPEVEGYLQEVISFLKQNPTLKVEIGAHTECVGNDKNNLILSRYRAEAAKAYLQRKGIEHRRLISKGYGETQILNTCKQETDCTESEHIENQRLEVKILSLD